VSEIIKYSANEKNTYPKNVQYVVKFNANGKKKFIGNTIRRPINFGLDIIRLF